jgi:hypothetical protein
VSLLLLLSRASTGIGAAKVGTPAEVATGTTVTGNQPSGLADGDTVFAIFGFTDSLANFTAPSGWNLVTTPQQIVTNTETLAVYYRRFATAASWSAPVGSWPTAGRGTCETIAYAGVDPTTPFDVAVTTVTNTTAGTTAVVPALTPLNAGTRLVSVCMADTASSNTVTAPGSMSLLSISTGTGRRLAVA